MRVENRSGIMDADTQIICICENETESKIVDLLGKPDDKIKGELRLSDGYGEFYILLKPKSDPVSTPPIVCLCGSTKFMDAFFEAGWQFTLLGKIVLSVGVCKHAEHHGGEALGQEVADKLDELHLRKIDLANEVFILNVGGDIGKSTRKEIQYAESKGKPIQYLEERRCRACDCTEQKACPGGCHWIEPDLCSQCEGKG